MKRKQKWGHMAYGLDAIYRHDVQPTVSQNTAHAIVGEFVFLAASLILARVGVAGDLDTRRRRGEVLMSSLKRRCGLTTGRGLYSSCSTGRRDFVNTSSGRL